MMIRPGRVWASVITVLMAVWGQFGFQAAEIDISHIEGYQAHPTGTITFNKDIAPLIYQHCSNCHRPGQSGPFSLLEYKDIRKRLDTICDRVSRRAMPPWQPEAGYGEFEGERRLTVQEIGLIQQWAREGAPEGEARDLPPRPVWTDGWQLGPPDLRLTPSEPYRLQPEGRDVYATFVIPVPDASNSNRYVRAMEFHPRNRAVHHASLLVEEATFTKGAVAKAAGGALIGMDLPSSAVTPQGHFLSWQPGRSAYLSPQNAPWILPKGAHLILQLHLNPTGKEELIQPEFGLFFTSQAPTRPLYKFPLQSREFEIPAGCSNYTIVDSYRLPVNVSLLGIYPHAHYLGRDLQGYAILPDGSRRELIRIRNWDFAWQGDYRLKAPLDLPKGTTLNMRFVYDNSTDNPRNPFHPPMPIGYGLQTVDEMAELWFQVTGNAGQLSALANDLGPKLLRDNLAAYRYRLRLNPKDVQALTKLGACQLGLGQTAQAISNLCSAVDLQPGCEDAHSQLGLAYRMQGKLDQAQREFERVLALNPAAHQAYGNLGLIAAQRGALEQAEKFFRNALAVDPSDEIARDMLAEIQRARKPAKIGESP